jgi:integrase
VFNSVLLTGVSISLLLDISPGIQKILPFVSQVYPSFTPVPYKKEVEFMGKLSENRVKFSKPNLTAIERRVNSGKFTKESYLYDSASHLAIRVRPNHSFPESAFCVYERIRIRGQQKSKLYKRQIMKVGEARNADVPISELRQKADSLFLEIQEGRDPQLLAQQLADNEADELKLTEAKRTFRDMIFGSPSDQEGEYLLNGFIAERRPGERYLIDIKNRSAGLLADLLDESLCAISAEQVKTVYLQQVGKGETQLNNAMRILRSVWNWAQVKYDESDLFLRNPVSKAMKQLGVNINRSNCRTDRLDDSDFKPYLKAVLGLREHDHTSAFRNGRDSLLFMLFTAVRLTGTMTIRIADIDLERQTFKIIKKGGKQVELPLNTVTDSIVRHRLKHLPENTEYLFPGVSGSGYYRDTSGVRTIVKKASGVSVTNHDLRRTYKSIGAELDVSPILIDELLSHVRGGVDAHYIHPSMTSLREASQRIADYMVQKSGFDLTRKLTDNW